MDQENAKQTKPIHWVYHVVLFVLVAAFYLLTRPMNHAESYDGITYALIAENFPLGTAHDSRNILFHAVNRVLFVATQSAGIELRAIDAIAIFNSLAAALSLLLFAHLMRAVFKVSTFSSWTGAAFLGLTYGFWRYAGEAEVYVPSIFLVLCSLTLLCRYLEKSDSETSGVMPSNKLQLLVVGIISGTAVLFYQANAIPLFIAGFVLFRWSRISSLLSYAAYSVVAVLVVFTGIIWACGCINGGLPSVDQIVAFMTERNSEFPEPSSFLKMAVKSVLGFGHDVFTANWTQTLAPVRDALTPLVPGCLYNFKVAEYAGVNLQAWTIIAPILVVPILFLLVKFLLVAAKRWTVQTPQKNTLFLVAWVLAMVAVVGSLSPGAFEAWIPMLVPVTALLTIFVIEPCYQAGKQKTMILFILLLFCYNFLGGMILWQNTAGDSFLQKTSWIRQELDQNDTILLNEFDFRIVDYLCYRSDAHVAHLMGNDQVVLHRSSPEITMEPLADFLQRHQQGERRLFVMGDVLHPNPKIKECKEGERKLKDGIILAEQLKDHATLVNTQTYGKTFQIFQTNE